ncbi:hypothetical protein LCGC14_0187730 [marine sediment metagenome]|uniref:Uncharacterized protein n=2 Tax=root TaxID=1 RepID=A0A9C9TIK0_9HYPH|nr:hypothetical protein [Aurantimonas coralicida]
MARDDNILMYGNARDSKLYKLFFSHLPNHHSEKNSQVLDCVKIGEDIGITNKAVYKWFVDDIVPGRRVKELIDLDGSTLTAEMLLPFLAR